jgi:DNA-binding NarL/FixJ family response regulator
VLDCLTAGMTNREIAERLLISVGTVKSQVGALLSLMQARNPIQLAELQNSHDLSCKPEQI